MKANTKKRSDEDEPNEEGQPLGHGEKLSRKTEAAIVALLTHPTLAEAAKACGVSEATLWRWLQREDFQKQYREAQDKAFDGALGTLQSAATQAIKTLERNLDCSIPQVQITAAKMILEFTLKAREHFDYAARIKELESRLKDREDGA